MEAVSTCNPALSDCNRDMEHLLEAFGSSFSLESIASAYTQASHNVDLAGVILYELQGASALSYESKDDTQATSISQLPLSPEDSSKYPYMTKQNDKILPTRNYISGISGGESLKSTNGGSRNTGKDGSLHADVEEFIFKMLGDGFQFDMKKIHEVLGHCGYDLEKSMETLVDLSASTLEKSDDVVSRCAEKEVHLKTGSVSEDSQASSSLREITFYSIFSYDNGHYLNIIFSCIYNNERMVKQNGKESRKKNKEKHDLQREILGALFTTPGRVEELPKKASIGTRRVRTYGRKAVEPVKETVIEQTFVSVKPLAGHNEAVNEEDENSFSVLRQAVKENWAAMKEYYKAATDAFTKGDEARAYKLMEEGHFYNKKARKADEKSAQKLLETRDDEMLLDISTLEPKEAIKLLKLHLTNLAGIPTIRFLKVCVGNDDGESKKGCLKRLVLKLLEKESIHWNEGEDGRMIVVQLDEINPKTLNFTKK
ncbi:putative nuclear RNA export factor SDE5 [Bienertia sinuspersici]